MKQKYLTAQEQLKKTAAEHRKELETVQTKYTFDVSLVDVRCVGQPSKGVDR
jgi:hypothetical protein